ncbi:hypothetical protein [Kurthia zopfii]|nr:hypothetical protein [Kurthia zopfii]
MMMHVKKAQFHQMLFIHINYGKKGNIYKITCRFVQVVKKQFTSNRH